MTTLLVTRPGLLLFLLLAGGTVIGKLRIKCVAVGPAAVVVTAVG